MLEFFEDGDEGRPMLLLYGGGPEEVVRLRNALRTLSGSIGHELDLTELPFVRQVDRCRLRATCAEADLGVVTRAPGDFEWRLDPESWLQVDGLLEPFGKQKRRIGCFFQHLHEGRGPAIFYSTAREW